MNDTLVIARREVAEKRFVFVAALAFAAIAVIIPFAVRAKHPAEFIVILSMVCALNFSLGLSAVLGGSIVGRDITAGRMSFYFARPVSALSIWFGKLAAAALLVVASFVIIAVPAVAAGMPLNRIWGTSGLVWAGMFLSAAAGLFFVLHAAGTMVRSRSALIVLDFVAAVVAGWCGWMIVRPLVEGGATRAVNAIAGGASILLVAGFLAAGAWQLADGRTDRRRSHAAFSKVFWGSVAVVLLIAASFGGWVVFAPPSALGKTAEAEMSSGNMALLAGTAEGRFDFHPQFLYNIATGDYERLGGAWHYGGVLSRDGSKFIAVERTSMRANYGEVVIRDTKPGSPFVGTSIMAGGFDYHAESNDGSRIAIVRDGNLSVYDTVRRQSLGSMRLQVRPHAIFFTSADSLRIYAVDNEAGRSDPQPRHLESYDYDIPARAFSRVGELKFESRFVTLTTSDDGSRLFVRTGPHEAMLCDGRTLQPIATLTQFRRGTFLRDGRPVMVLQDDTVTIANRDGAVVNKIAIPKHAGVYGIAEVAPGKLVVPIVEGGKQSAWHALLVDVDRGVLRSDPDLHPVVPVSNGIASDPRPTVIAPTMLMTTPGGSLVAWNALTGERRDVIR